MSKAATMGARGGGVTLLAQAVKMVLQFASVVLLSRLLSPSDFGLIAMVAVFISLGELIRDFGTSTVGIGRHQLTHQQSSNLFWMSTALGAIASIGVTAATPLLVGLYNEPRLTTVVPALAISLLLNAISTQYGVQLARSMMHWRRLAVAVIPQACGLAVALLAASSGFGYWTLVVQAVCVSAVGLALRARLTSWRPGRPRKDPGNRLLLKDSARFGFAGIAHFASQNLDTVLVGATWGAATLGAYNRAFQLLALPLRQLVAPLTQVVIPAVNRAAEEGRSKSDTLLMVQFALGGLIGAMFSIAGGSADWLIPFVLGDGWVQSVAIFQILAVGGLAWFLNVVVQWIFIVYDLAKKYLLLSLVANAVSSGLIVAASFISIEAVAWAVSAGLALAWPLGLLWLRGTAGVEVGRFARGGVHLAFAACVAFLASRAAPRLVHDDPSGTSALIGIILGIALFSAIMLATRGTRLRAHRLANLIVRSV